MSKIFLFVLIILMPVADVVGGTRNCADAQGTSCSSHKDFVDDLREINRLLVTLKLSPQQCYIAVRAYRGDRSKLDESIKESASLYLQEQLALKPAAQQYYELALLQKSPEKAIQYLSEAVRLEPSNAQYFNARGNAYDSIGQYEKAIKDYSDAIRLDPVSGFPYQGRSYSYESLGEYDKAAKDLEAFFKTCQDKKYVDMVRESTCRTLVVDHNKTIEGCPVFEDYVKSGAIKYTGEKK